MLIGWKFTELRDFKDKKYAGMRQLIPETPKLVVMQKSSKMEVEEGYTMSYLSLISEQINKDF